MRSRQAFEAPVVQTISKGDIRFRIQKLRLDQTDWTCSIRPVSSFYIRAHRAPPESIIRRNRTVVG